VTLVTFTTSQVHPWRRCQYSSPGPRLPSHAQPAVVSALRPVLPIYDYCLECEQQRLQSKSGTAEDQTRELSIARSTCYPLHHQPLTEYSSLQLASPLRELMPPGITQCNLPPGTRDIPTFTPAKLVLDLVALHCCRDARLTGYIQRCYTRPTTVTDPSTNQTRCRVTLLILATTTLLLSHAANLWVSN